MGTGLFAAVGGGARAAAGGGKEAGRARGGVQGGRGKSAGQLRWQMLAASAYLMCKSPAVRQMLTSEKKKRKTAETRYARTDPAQLAAQALELSARRRPPAGWSASRTTSSTRRSSAAVAATRPTWTTCPSRRASRCSTTEGGWAQMEAPVLYRVFVPLA